MKERIRFVIMSRQRRCFSAKFKSGLVIELLKEEKDLDTIVTENNIQPNSSPRGSNLRPRCCDII